MKTHLILAFAVAHLSSAYSQTPASSSNAVIAWGKSIGALKVGISCDNTTSDLRRLPKIFFHVANDGDKEIPGIILSGSECIVTVNGQHYAQESYGGKSSWMPPGRKYGPIAIDTDRLRQIPELRARPTITQTAPRPELREGTNTLSVHYMRDEKLVESGQIQTIANAPVVRAEDYRLVQSYIGDEIPLHGPVESATVYVLVCPDQRLYVFRAFHSHPMEEIIKHFPRGSVLHYDGNALAARPPEAQMQALSAFCKSKGIDLVLTPTN